MNNVIQNWGALQTPAKVSPEWLAILDQALEKPGGVLPLDPRNNLHAEVIASRLGDESFLSAYFPRKANMLRATASLYELYGSHPGRTLLQMTPEEAGSERFHAYVAIPHLAYCSHSNAVVATAVISHPDTLQALEMTLEIIDAETGDVIGSTSVPPQFSSRYLRATVNAPLPATGKPKRLVAALTSNYVVDGEPYANPSLLAVALNATAITMVTPFAPLPIKHPGAKVVKIAIKREGLDVDYAYPQMPTPNEIIVPFSGQAQLALGYSVAQQPCQSGSLQLSLKTGGGGQYALAQADVIAAFGASEGGIFTWAMGPDWQQKFPVLAGVGDFDIQLSATLNVTSAAGPDTTQLNVSSFGTPTTGGSLWPLNIQWGCVAPQTRVRLADGSEQTIAQLNAGDLLVSDIQGRTSRVERIIVGEQTDPMWRLQCGEFEVLATEDHPVMTAAGPRAISRLQPGDWVCGYGGELRVDSICAEPYEGKVFNLILQSEDGVVPLKGDYFVANGLFIGDNTQQNWLGTQQPPAFTPHEWKLDADNARYLTSGEPLVRVA